ncbi:MULTISPECIES: ATP-binding protein [unclassified Sutcliffiella]|uniref:ATP-binding protein n=1 Tax=unclassified Sutcliffiella TaxID=2837532 RepID=UPI0030D58335
MKIEEQNLTVATYFKQDIKEYEGNPFIEALPEIKSQSSVYDTLNKTILFTDLDRSLPLEHRYHLILRFSTFFQPISATLDLERKLSMLLRSGYISRNPYNKIANLSLYDRNINTSTVFTKSFSLMGFPGMGKSRNIESVLSMYSQVLVHRSPVNRLQIVWLKLNCPHDGSLKTLCISFFKEIDNLIGTDYSYKFGNNRVSVSAMVTHMAHLSKIHVIGVLVIDEIQHLLSKRGGSTEQMMNFFVTLTNSIGIPTLLIGTMSAKSILQKDLRQARRSSGLGDLVWENFNSDDEEWDAIVETLWQNQITREYTPLTPQIKKLLYEETQGIIDILIKLFWLTQCRSMELGIEKLNVKLIKAVSHEDLKLVKPFIGALKSNNEKEIIKYNDILPLDIKEYISNRKGKPLKIISEAKGQKNISKFQEIMNYLQPLNLDLYKTEIIVKSCLYENKNATLAEVLKIVVSELMENKQPIKTIKTVIYTEILKLAKEEDAPEKIHKYLIDAKFISNPFDDFMGDKL